MFVRWRTRTRRARAFGRDPRADTHWAAILAESSRIDGKPTQRHIAYLGGITESAIELPAQHAFFWKEVKQQLDQLAVSKDDRARIEAAVEAKVPRLIRREYNEWLIRREGLGMDFASKFAARRHGGSSLGPRRRTQRFPRSTSSPPAGRYGSGRKAGRCISRRCARFAP